MGKLEDEIAEARRRLLQGKCVFCLQSDDDGRVMVTNGATNVSVCEHCVRNMYSRLMQFEVLRAMPDGMTPQ